MTETIQTDDHVGLVSWNRDTGGLGNGDVVDVTFREFRSKTMLDLCWIGFEAVCSGCFHGHC